MIEYPEHEKLKALNGKNDVIGSFLDWLDERGFEICVRPGCGKYETCYLPTSKRPEQWIAEFFEIDRAKLEAEKRQMLEEFRAAPRPSGKETQ